MKSPLGNVKWHIEKHTNNNNFKKECMFSISKKNIPSQYVNYYDLFSWCWWFSQVHCVMSESHTHWVYVLYVYCRGTAPLNILVELPDAVFVHVWSACMYKIDWLWWSTAVTNLFPISDWLLLFTALSSNSVPYASLIGSVSSLSSQTTTQSLYDNNSLPRFARKGLNIFVSIIFSVQALF